MDVLEFVARSEWPVVVLVGVWLFRRAIRGIFERINLTKLDAWGLKAEFEKGLAKAELLTPLPDRIPVERPKLAMNEAPTVSLPRLSEDALTQGASPELVVLRAWRDLDVAMKRALGELRRRTPHFIRLDDLCLA